MGNTRIVGYSIKEPPFGGARAANLLSNEKCLKVLNKIPFIQAFGDEFLVDIIKSSKVHKYSKDTFIITEGTYDSRFFVIISGSVKIIKDGIELTTLETTGDIFGEIAVIDGCSRSASVLSTADTICLAVDASVLERLNYKAQVKFCSIFYRLMSENMANFLRKTSADLIESQKKLTAAETKIDEMQRNLQHP